MSTIFISESFGNGFNPVHATCSNLSILCSFDKKTEGRLKVDTIISFSYEFGATCLDIILAILFNLDILCPWWRFCVTDSEFSIP